MIPVRILALLLLGVVVVGLILLPQILQEFFPVSFAELIQAAGEHHEVDWALIAAIIQVESSYSPSAVSKKGAVGLMQVMPETAAWVSSRLGKQVAREDLLDPEVNRRPTTEARVTWPAGWKKEPGMAPMSSPTAYLLPKPGLMCAKFFLCAVFIALSILREFRSWSIERSQGAWSSRLRLFSR